MLPSAFTDIKLAPLQIITQCVCCVVRPWAFAMWLNNSLINQMSHDVFVRTTGGRMQWRPLFGVLRVHVGAIFE
jgi:hypothetical protein